VLALFVACAAPPAAPRPPPPTPLEDVAVGAFDEKLRELGYRVDAAAAPTHGRAVTAARDGATWYLALDAQSSTAPEGPKVLVRVSVFREPGRTLRGEVAPYAIAQGSPSSAEVSAALARAVAERAASQFAENFRPSEVGEDSERDR